MRLPLTLLVAMLLTMAVAAQDEGRLNFARCAACHAVGAGAENKIGPQLNGIVGRPVAGLPGYNYSQTLRDAGAQGLAWDEQLLTRYLKNPRHTLPGTSMTFAGMRQRADIEALIDYMAGFDADGAPAAQ